MTDRNDKALWSDSRLEDELWGAAPLAWLGTSAGCMAMFSSTFWRFVMYPPRPLYGLNDGIWVFPGYGGGEIIHGQKPEMDPAATMSFVMLFIAGLALCWFASKPWRDIRAEIVKRRRAAQ